MPRPELPPHPETQTAPTVSPAEADADARAEREATKRLFDIWKLPEGPCPWATLLIVVCSVLATALSWISPERAYAWFYASGTDVWLSWKWWGLIGSAFLHGGTLHLVFNCCWVWLFGRLLERELGPCRYTGLFLASAWLGGVAELGWEGQPGIGLSGVVYAFFGFLLVNKARHPDFARILPRQTVVLFGCWLIACFVMTHLGVFQVANLGHVGGLVAGCLIGYMAYPNPRRRQARIAAISCGLGSLSLLFWAPWQEQWQEARAYHALEAGDTDTALVTLQAIRVKNPANNWALLQEAPLRQAKGEYALARDILDQASHNEINAEVMNSLAWLLATCPAPEIRDGPKAVKLALRACEISEWKNAAILDTLAVAYAETGDFLLAVEWAGKALALPNPHSVEIQIHLDSFRAQKPWREPNVSVPH